MENTGVLAQYANVFIPLGVSIVVAVGTFFVYREKVGRLEKDVDDFKKELRGIRDKVISCETILKERGPVVKSESPMRLTDRGKALIEDSGGREFIDNNFVELEQRVIEKGDKTAYDIQENSRKVLSEMREDDRFSRMKEYLFDEGTDIKELILALGVYLRDKILNKRHIAQEEVDKHDPNNH